MLNRRTFLKLLAAQASLLPVMQQITRLPAQAAPPQVANIPAALGYGRGGYGKGEYPIPTLGNTDRAVYLPIVQKQ